ncbi:MAG: hypothetical protein ABR555_05105 [Pyrinomonadaceae bacterium]
MPKDPTRNVDRYKIRGGSLNEFEFTQNQEQLAESANQETQQLIPGTPPEKKLPSRLKPTSLKGSSKASAGGRRGSKSVLPKSNKGANSAKTRSTKAAAGKKTTKKTPGKKTSAKARKK